MIGAILPSGVGASTHDREPGIHAMRRIHLARHHAGDGERLTVKIDRAPNNLGIPVEGAVPQAIADHHQRRRARFIFIFAESAADLRRQPDHVEKVRGHKSDRYSLRFAASNAAEIARLQAGEREVLERGAVAPPIDVIRQGDGGVCSVDDLIKINKALRLRIRERTQEHRVDHAEDRGVRADAEREREHGDKSEPG